MKALVFSSSENAKENAAGARLALSQPLPRSPPPLGEATVRVLRAGICATDLEIVRGYVPGFEGVLGHEFVGEVVEVSGEGGEGEGGEDEGKGVSTSSPWLGARVVADINCRPHGSVPLSSFPLESEQDRERRLLARNHEAGRTVLGIIGRDGALAEFVSLPLANLHRVPCSLSDKAAAFAEPLAAALRVLEQGIIKDGDAVAVVGDGRLGLLVAAALSVGAGVSHGSGGDLKKKKSSGDLKSAPVLSRLVHFGRRKENLGLVPRMIRGGEHETVVVPRRGGGEGEGEGEEEDETSSSSSPFDVVVEASGSSSGVELALRLCRPLGTIVLKTTCAPPEASCDSDKGAKKQQKAVFWAAVANDAVVNEKSLVGSRCGPLEDALRNLEMHPELVDLVESMVRHDFSIDQGVEALRRAAEPGALKVQVVFL